MMTSSAKWDIRPAIGSDLHFIYATWLNSFRSDSGIGSSCQSKIYFQEYYSVLDYILSKLETKILVACKPDEIEVIFGFLVFEPGVLHYAFTKDAFRNYGIANSLLEKSSLLFVGAGEIFYTHKTRSIHRIVMKFPKLSYNPFLLFSRAPHTQSELRYGKAKPS